MLQADNICYRSEGQRGLAKKMKTGSCVSSSDRHLGKNEGPAVPKGAGRHLPLQCPGVTPARSLSELKTESKREFDRAQRPKWGV